MKRLRVEAAAGALGAFQVFAEQRERFVEPAEIVQDETLSGLVASVPMMAGALLQLASPVAVRKLGSHRRWVIVCATCQALSFIPLVAAAVVGYLPAFWVFAMRHYTSASS